MRTSIRSLSKINRVSGAVTASVVAVSLLTSTVARADATSISPTGKGIVGGALLGGELVTIVEAIANVHNGWAYAVGAVVGAAGGGVGGYFVEQNDSTNGRVPVYMLAIGVGMVIPALVLSLNATRYQPNENATEDRAPTNAPAANPGMPGSTPVGPVRTPAPATNDGSSAPPITQPPAGNPPPKTSEATSAPHLSLFDVNDTGMHFGLPVPEVRQTFSAVELRQYGLAQQTEVRLPVVKIAF